MFALADRHGLEIHPLAMRAAGARRQADRRQRCAPIPRANALFLDVLTSPRDPETVLRWMNEAGVFGRFVPDFGRVVAQMQFDMYHHYTVDEHSIRAIGLLARIERGAAQGRSSARHRACSSRSPRAASLYVAVLLHDIAKGRGGDHSVLGAEVALALCPRLGLTDAETETVAWLVRWHLLMSATAFKRDLADPKTIHDFVERVKSLERLRLLLPADRGRHPRGRPGHLEQLEAPAAARPCSTRPRRCFGSATSRRAARSGSPRPRTSWPRGSAGTQSRFARLMPGGCPIPTGSPSRSTCSSATPA